MKKTWIPLVAMIIFIAFSCNESVEQGKYLADESIDMSETLLMSDESSLDKMPQYSSAEEGESTTIDRAFENAPPMISHKVEGLLPIKIDNNECLRCHIPERAKKNYKATFIPKTHMTSYRPDLVEEDGIVSVNAKPNEVVSKDLGKLNTAMFNCTLCHAPQAEVDLEVQNLFQADFRRSNGKSSSNLADVIGEGVK